MPNVPNDLHIYGSCMVALDEHRLLVAGGASLENGASTGGHLVQIFDRRTAAWERLASYSIQGGCNALMMSHFVPLSADNLFVVILKLGWTTWIRQDCSTHACFTKEESSLQGERCSESSQSSGMSITVAVSMYIYVWTPKLKTSIT